LLLLMFVVVVVFRYKTRRYKPFIEFLIHYGTLVNKQQE